MTVMVGKLSNILQVTGTIWVTTIMVGKLSYKGTASNW